MTIHEFLEVIYANRDLLAKPGLVLDPEDTHPAAVHTGCPLRAAMVVCCPLSIMQERLFMMESGKCVSINPDPDDAARYLYLDSTFTTALANAWDMGRFYGDTEEFELEFAGFLIGFTLLPAPLQLTA